MFTKSKLFSILLFFLCACTAQNTPNIPDPTLPPPKPGSGAPVVGVPVAELPTPASTPLPTADLPDGSAVQQLLLFSHERWQSFWADAFIVYYAGDGSNQPVQTMRTQAWVNLPAQARLLNGSADGTPSSVWVSDGSHYRQDDGVIQDLPSLSPFTPPSLPTDTIYPHPFGSLLGAPLSDMFFPTSLAQRGGEYTITAREIFANRETVVVTWTRFPAGEMIDRFWVDTQTGMILRWQNFGKPGGQAMTTEMYVTTILFDIQFPDTSFYLGLPYPSGFAKDYHDLLIK